jgi:hypothetical protein
MPRYGRPHRRIRAKYAAQVPAGLAICWRCGNPIDPKEAWDLGHLDGGGPRQYAGPEHRRCNRSTASRRNVKRPVDPALYLDDPERDGYWGPPSEPGGEPIRWSRAWFDWRKESGG